MADITKCEGGVCPYKEKCLRYTARDGSFQSCFAEVPIKDGKCDWFWGELQDIILKDLMEIVK